MTVNRQRWMDWLWVMAAFVVIAGVRGFKQLQTAGRGEEIRQPASSEGDSRLNTTDSTGTTMLATFGSGCFWCTEAVFEQLRGVVRVTSGYSGGTVQNPTYEQVCSGTTGHAECIQVEFDPALITYELLLQVFWQSHDPTTLNRQGNDVGTQYRSVIFYHDDQQKNVAEKVRERLDQAKAFERPIVTEIVPFQVFFPAEDYHQEYYQLNGRQPYCSVVIRPKVEKVQEVFAELLRGSPGGPGEPVHKP